MNEKCHHGFEYENIENHVCSESCVHTYCAFCFYEVSGMKEYDDERRKQRNKRKAISRKLRGKK